MNEAITIRLPKDLKASLERLSKTQSIPISDLVRESIRRYIAIHQFQILRNKVLPFAEAQGILTDNDVLKAMK